MTNFSSRREFMRLAARLGGLGVAAPLGMNLSTIRAASAMANPNDYRALVCVFLYGGNDAHNTVVAYDNERYGRYAAARQQLSVKRADLADTIIQPDDGWGEDYQFALHPNLKPLKTLFDEGSLSVMMRVGTLNTEIDINDYRAKRNLPAKLMSHNDQFSLWQSLSAEGARSGWGGRIGDIIGSANGNNDILSNISIDSSAVFSTGTSVSEFLVSSSGPVALDQLRSNFNTQQAISRTLSQDSDHLIHREMQKRIGLANLGAQRINAALGGPIGDGIPNTELGKQLAMVTRLIEARQNMGMKRQVFFVSLGGFDSHGNLGSEHPALLDQLGGAMFGFQRALEARGLQNNVTTFTASDFGRSLVTNKSGSDHGWGGHQFVMGGALKPRTWRGAAPTLIGNGPDDIGQGRLLPAIAVEQLGSTLAKWMGVPDSELDSVFPNLANFSTRDLDIFA